MRELLDELRARQSAVFIVMVGTLVAYEVQCTDPGHLRLLRTAQLSGEANEGEAKVTQMQAALGRRPVLDAGKSAGDREMIEFTLSGPGPGPSLGLLVDHDDAKREVADESVAATLDSAERITDVASAEGWTIVSMRHDRRTVLPG